MVAPEQLDARALIVLGFGQAGPVEVPGRSGHLTFIGTSTGQYHCMQYQEDDQVPLVESCSGVMTNMRVFV